MRVRQQVLDAIGSHARRASPQECCGLLIGHSDRVTEAVATDNAAGDPLRRYEISPVEYVTQIRRCRALEAEGGVPLAVIGAYHSHPRSAPEPSPTDLEYAFHDFLFMIAGPVSEVARLEIRGYRLRDGKLDEVQLVRDDN